MTRSAIAILVVLAGLLAFVACGRGAQGQTPAVPSFQRVFADPPISVVVVRAAVDDTGQVSQRKEPVANILPDDTDRVLDYISEPGYSYVTACQFTQRDPVTYWWTGYLPLVVPGSAKRRR